MNNNKQLPALDLSKRVISLVLAVTMIFNLSGQAFSYTPKKTALPEDYRKNLERQVHQAVQDNTAMPRVQLQQRVMKEMMRINDGSLTPADKQRIHEIESIFNPLLKSESPDSEFEAFSKAYVNSIEQAVRRETEELAKESKKVEMLMNEEQESYKKKKYDEDKINVWRAEGDANLKKWQDDAHRQLAAWKKNQLSNIKKAYEDAKNNISLDEREQAVSEAVRDLWMLKDKAPYAKRTLLVLAPSILPLKDLKGNSFFNAEQREWLESNYRQILQKEKSCVKDANTAFPKINCDTQFAAIVALGMMSNDRNAAYDIIDFMTANRESHIAVPTLISGTAALLAMKQYAPLRGFLHEATLKERDMSAVDILSFENAVNNLATINGEYLGQISKLAEYPLTANPDEKSATGNAWEDVASVLAQHNTPESLALLREFGVEQCAAAPSLYSMDNKTLHLYCTGIKPFLVGALRTGKSGAEQYSRRMADTSAGSSIGNYGTRIITEEEAQRNRQRQQNTIASWRAFVKQSGLTAPAAVARALFVESMGDLSAESELELDQKLYKVYETSLKTNKPNPGYAITAYTRGSAEYNAKRVRQDRVRFWRTAGKVGDIALLIWCVVDISKWAFSGAKIAAALAKASAMARGGASVAQRAMMLRRLNVVRPIRKMTAIPVKVGARVRAGMAPAVTSQMHFFANAPQMPKIAGFIESAGTIAKANVRFSAEAGVLTLDAKNILESSGGTLNVKHISDMQKSLAAASENANTAFANRASWKKIAAFNQNAAYRKYLAREITSLPSVPGLTGAEASSLAFGIKNSAAISVPANIASFKTPSLLTGGALNSGALTQVMYKTAGVMPTTKEVTRSAALFNDALERTNIQFANRNWFARSWNRMWGNANKTYKNMLLDNLAASYDRDGMMFKELQQRNLYRSFVAAVQNDRTIKAPASLKRYKQMPYNPEKTDFKRMGTALLSSSDPNVLPADLPLDIYMDTGISGVRPANSYQRVIFTDKKTDKGSVYLFGMGNNLSKPFQPQNFKITLPASDMPLFVRAVDRVNPAVPFELKLTPLKHQGFTNRVANSFQLRKTAFMETYAQRKWYKPPFKEALVRDKKDIYIHEIPVFRRTENGGLSQVPLLLKADSYLGLKGTRAVLETNGQMAWYQGGRALADMPLFSYGIPKTNLRPFVDVVQKMGPGARLSLQVKSTRSKMLPLYVATGLSLSSASTSLIAPLENIYGSQITDTDKTLISLALPYIPSLAAPLFSPLVMKVGALKAVKMALFTSTTGLFFAYTQGFNGKVNESHLPPIWPLFVSGAAIGVSSALSRSGLNLLIDSIGGGGSLLKSMAYKNIGSFALLVPPILYNAVKGPGEGDFSLAFPVLATLSGLSLGSMYFSRIDTNIGKTANFMKFAKFNGGMFARTKTFMGNTRIAFKEGWRETASSFRILGSKELLPLTAAAFAFTGFEAATFNKASNQLIRPEVSEMSFIKGIDERNRKNWIALITSGTVVLFPMLTRFGAKPAMSALANPLKEGIEYKRMLKISYGLNIAGGTMLMNYGFDGFDSPGFLGIALVGLGTANVTQSLQKLSNLKVLHGRYVTEAVRGLATAEANAFRKATVTKAMTVFPVSQIGLATVPMIVSGYTDRQVRQERIETQNEAPRTSLWIPLTSIAASVGFAGSSIGLLPQRLPTGLLGVSKGIFGSYPIAFKNAAGLLPYQVNPYYGQPQNYVPLPNLVINPQQIIPTDEKVKQ